MSSRISQSLCNTYENTIKLANLLVSIISPALSLSYAASGHPVVQGGLSASDPGYILAAHATCSAYLPYRNANDDIVEASTCANFPLSSPSTPSICETKINHMSNHAKTQYHCVDVCEGYTKQDECTTAGCNWVSDGFSTAKCARGFAQWMLHQSYPLEASLITLVTSFMNVGFFWPQYFSKELHDTIMEALRLQASANVCPDCVPASAPPPPLVRETQDWQQPFNISVGGGLSTDATSINYTAALMKSVSVTPAGADWNTISNMLKAPPGPSKRSSSTSESAKQDIRRLVMGVPHVFVLKYIQTKILPPRDVMIAFYEVVRASVYVADPTDLNSPDFAKFTLVRSG